MQSPLTAIEMTGTIDEYNRLQLDTTLPIRGPKRVRVIVLYPLDAENDEIIEDDWLNAIARSPAFASLAEPGEDIYTLEDGRPFEDDQV